MFTLAYIAAVSVYAMVFWGPIFGTIIYLSIWAVLISKNERG